MGRGFIYGFLFPIYFILLLWGVVALVAFLIVAGIIAAIVFVMVWVSEKLLPHEWFGESCFGSLKRWVKGAVVPVEQTKTVIPVPSEPVATEQPSPPPPAPSEETPKPEGTP